MHHFKSLKTDLLENSLQGEDIQKLSFQSLLLNGQKGRFLQTMLLTNMFITVCSVTDQFYIYIWMILRYLSLDFVCIWVTECMVYCLTLYLYVKHKQTLIIQWRKRETKTSAYNVMVTNYPRGFCEEQSCFTASFIVFSVTKQPEYMICFLFTAAMRYTFSGVLVWTEIISEMVLKN